MEKHVEENAQKHLALMAAVSMKMKQELQEQREEFRGYLEQKERETVDLHQQVKSLEVQSQHQVEWIEKLAKKLQE